MAESLTAIIDQQILAAEQAGLRVSSLTMSPLNCRRLSIEIADSVSSFGGGVWSIVTHYRGVPIHGSADCGESIWLTSYAGDPLAALHDAGPICPGCPLCTTTDGTRVPLSEGLE